MLPFDKAVELIHARAGAVAAVKAMEAKALKEKTAAFENLNL